MLMREALIADFKHEVESTRKILQAIPEDKLEWQPHEKSMSLGRLAGHVAENPGWIPAMMEDELDFAAAGSEYEPLIPTSQADLLEAFEKGVEGFETALVGRDDGFLSATWIIRQGDQVLMSQPRHEAIRSMMIHHFIHHRAQLTVYLRMLDIPVPQTYGPTADYPEYP